MKCQASSGSVNNRALVNLCSKQQRDGVSATISYLLLFSPFIAESHGMAQLEEIERQEIFFDISMAVGTFALYMIVLTSDLEITP